jgi:hypothetical protein
MQDIIRASDLSAGAVYPNGSDSAPPPALFADKVLTELSRSGTQTRWPGFFRRPFAPAISFPEMQSCGANVTVHLKRY